MSHGPAPTARTRPRRRRSGRAAFLAVKLEVAASLAAEKTVIAIYEEHQARLGMSYPQFARYVARLRSALKLEARRTPPASAPPPAPRRDPPGPRSAAPPTNEPPRGRPEDAVPTLDMDGFAARALNNEDLF